MKEQVPQHEHYLRGHKDSEDISELSEKLAPPEELVTKSASEDTSRENDGVLVVDTGALKMPKGYLENDEDKRGLFGLEPIIVVILILLILFIAFIAYLIYLTPAR